MIAKEKREIEKMKLRQQKELEQMMEYGLKLQKIREENEKKTEFQKEQERIHRQIMERKQREAELKKKKDEDWKWKEQAELEEINRKRA